MMPRRISQHTEWLSLIEVSGPFLVVSELEKVFPQGLDIVETPRRQRLRAAYEEWCDAVDENDPQLLELHKEWIRLVLTEILEYDDDVLISNEKMDEPLSYTSPEHAGTFLPDFVIRGDSDDKPKLIISIQPPETDLEKVKVGDGWPASLLERMTLLCRQTDTSLGFLTNGERWMLVNAPVGSTSGHASWYARLWFQESLTLKAFQSLLGIRRCFGPKEESLEALLEESLKHQEEVTDTLGEQAKRAVEVLVQCLDKADQDRNRELLRDVPPAELYEAGLTVMMRLVFILCAEERGLLLLEEPTYEQNYAVSSLRAQLDENADHHGPEVLERRHDAWTRLLAIFRAIYGGIEYETLRMPALGGSLFDPDRFPFLEGRTKGTSWRDIPAKPLPIDNRTVLLLLNALQVLEQRGGALLLSYKALDVEQIGHVYEGLLEHTVARVPEVTIGLEGSQKAKNPNLALTEMESACSDGEQIIVNLINEATKRSASAIKNALKKEVDDMIFAKVIAVCGGDMELAKRIRPYAHLLRADAWGDFIVYKANSFAVTLGADRRETGTHYTPKSLTESIVSTTLEPVVYIGPAEGKAKEEWKLKSSAELLDLKVCDPAMGSGAFLVQACRWLSERIVEAWGIEEGQGKFITVDGKVLDDLSDAEPMPKSLDDRLVVARRLIAERCLYGVDINPLAVELAKLSIWLVTLAKGRPFGFLDHNLRFGDSLLGIHKLDQLIKLTMSPDDPKSQLRIFGQNMEKAVTEAIELRKQLRQIPIRDIRDVEAMARLDEQARKKLEAIELIADAMIGEALCSNGNARNLDTALNSLAGSAQEFFNGNEEIGKAILKQSRQTLSVDLSAEKPRRNPFHWPLEFPEIFEKGGFDGIVGNPPFMGGRNISGNFGKSYLHLLKSVFLGSGAQADLVSYFFRRVFENLNIYGCMGLLSTNTIAEGDTRQTGLYPICRCGGKIYSATKRIRWPGTAAVVVSTVHISKKDYSAPYVLNGKPCDKITSYLFHLGGDDAPQRLVENSNIAFTGGYPYGAGFTFNDSTKGATPIGEMHQIIEHNQKNAERIFPYIGGEEFLNHPQQQYSRYVINFGEMEETEANNWPDLMGILREKVKPEREKLKDNADGRRRKKYWWRWGRTTPGLDKACNGLGRVLMHPFTSNNLAFAFVNEDVVVAAPHPVFGLNSFAAFACLQSKIHEVWVRFCASSFKDDLRYTASDSFETFPFPENWQCNAAIQEVGENYYQFRAKFMAKHNIGLTKIYNLFHNPGEKRPEIIKFRELHTTLDKVILKAYKWDDIVLEYGFFTDFEVEDENNKSWRYRWPDNVHDQVLGRLLELNHERYTEEVAQGLHDKNAKKKTAKKKNKIKEKKLF
ncbi:MAG: TetR family transcriptional regulator [Planctomycetes bacterium]|nr:TetR family transcriptional regulator [Planctomycetota bacterium]